MLEAPFERISARPSVCFSKPQVAIVLGGRNVHRIAASVQGAAIRGAVHKGDLHVLKLRLADGGVAPRGLQDGATGARLLVARMRRGAGDVGHAILDAEASKEGDHRGGIRQDPPRGAEKDLSPEANRASAQGW